MEALADVTTGTELPFATIALRLLAATILGGVIGIDREWRNRSAGLRTHMLTALAAALFTVLTFEIVNSDLLSSENTRADPIRIVEAVTAGVAFLAAGAIIHGRREVHGLTTGAGMWLAGSLGVACGLGYLAIALFAGILGIVVITLLGRLEMAMRDSVE